jgi:GNAT superfamily N-acetyltransferase
MELENGYEIREMTAQEFFPQFGKLYDSLFGDDHTFFPDAFYTDKEKEKLESIKNRLGEVFQLHLGLFSPTKEFVGFSFGFQENYESYYMAASAVLPAHRGQGLYSEMVKFVIERATNEGFQKIYGTHCATNNAVLVPKMKLGFIFSKIELSDMFGTVIHLQYFTNPLRRKVMDYRSGLTVPDRELKSVMKFDRKK